MKKRNLLLIFGCLFLIASPGKAQVTIGSNSEPLTGALLQLKENDNAATASNSSKGLLLPRVALTSTTVTSVITGLTAAPTNYKGLVVYNVGASGSTVPVGTYVWTGSEWHLLENLDSFNLKARNGLTYANNDSVVLGGTMTATSTTINLDDKTLIFDNVNAPAYSSSTRNVGLILKDLPDITTNSVGLVIDRETGRLGMNSAGIPAKLAFYQAAEEDYVSDLALASATGDNDDTTNAGRTRIVRWNEANDEFTNNLLDFVPSLNCFQIPDTVSEIMVELSGYIGYVANATSTTNATFNGGTNDVTIVNAAIQVQQVATYDPVTGSPTSYGNWVNWTSMRGVFPYLATPYRQTLSIPPALVKLSRYDRIRLVVIPYPSALGAAHTNGRVVAPYGTSIAKAIKIIAQ